MTALSSFGKLVKNVWAEYPLRMEGYFLIFIPVPLSQGEEGFLFLLVFYGTCPSVGAWWDLLVCKAY